MCRSAGSSRSRTRGSFASRTTKKAAPAGTTRQDPRPVRSSFLARATTAQQRCGRCCTTPDRRTRSSQTLLEMVRGGIRDLPVDAHRVSTSGAADSMPAFVAPPIPAARLEVRRSRRADARSRRLSRRRVRLRHALRVFRHVQRRRHCDARVPPDLGRLDAVWGSRRLSVRDIQESYRLKYRHRTMLGAISYAGSHAAQPAVSGALRSLRIRYALGCPRDTRPRTRSASPLPLTHKLANQHLLVARCYGARRKCSRCQCSSSRSRRSRSGGPRRSTACARS